MNEGFVTGIDRLLLDFSGQAVASARNAAESWSHGGHAINAMVLAAAAVEAHVGEWLALEDHRKLLETEIEEWKKSLPRPPQIIKTIVSKTSGTTIGSLPWFDRLQGLFELRNHAVHYYPERRPLGQFPEKLEDYIRRRVITPVGTDDMDWTSRLLVSSVAEQALCIAFEAIRGFDTEVATDDRAV